METVSTAARGGTITRPSAEKLALAMGKPLAALFVPQPRDNSLDASTVMRIRTALSPVFATAMKKEIITRNPVINATSPKDPAKTRDFLNAEQCRALLRILDDMPNRQNARAIQTLLLTGMRVGELTSLHWEDIDLEGGFVNIRYNLYRINGEYKLSTPKTRSSARVIAVPARVVEIFREQRAWQDNRRAEEKDRWIDRGCVFSGRYGEYMSRNYLNVEFKKTLAKYDFPRIHLHDLRHANASLLINMGVPVKVISEHLGHSSTLTTENIYAHVFNESRAKAADAVVRALSDVAGKN
jgi:integrase